MTDTRNKHTLEWMFWVMVWSFLFQAIGFVTPWWLNFQYDSSNVYNTGMWYTTRCWGFCGYIGVSEYKQKRLDRYGIVSSSMVQYQVETTLAILACIVAMVTFKRYKDSLPQDNSTIQPRTAMLYLGMFACFVSGILALTAVSSFGNKLIESKRLYSVLLNSSETPIKFPFSLFITAIGVLFAAVVFVTALVRKPWQLQTRRGNTQELIMPHTFQPTTNDVTSNEFPPTLNVSNNYQTPYVVSNNGNPYLGPSGSGQTLDPRQLASSLP